MEEAVIETGEKTLKLKKPLKMYKIVFHSGEGKDEAEDVIIGWNCKMNRWQRDVESTIDENFLGVLKDAVVKTILKGEDGKEREVTIPRFSYTVTPV